MPVSMPHQLPWSTQSPNPQPPLSVPPAGHGPSLFSRPWQQHQQFHRGGLHIQPSAPPMGAPPPSHQDHRHHHYPFMYPPPPPPHQQLPSNDYPQDPPQPQHQPLQQQQQRQHLHGPSAPHGLPSQPTQKLTLHGPSQTVSLIASSSSAPSAAIISLGPTPYFHLAFSKRSKPHLTLSRITSHRNQHPTGPPIATATWSSSISSAVDITLQLWPNESSTRATQVTLTTDPDSSVLGSTWIRNAPFGWGQQRDGVGGALRWEVELDFEVEVEVDRDMDRHVMGHGHVLRDGTGRVLARWDACGAADERVESANVVRCTGSGSGGNGNGDGDGDGGGRLTAALTPGGDPVLSITGAPHGVRIDDERWVEFVVATGVCVMMGKQRDGMDLLSGFEGG